MQRIPEIQDIFASLLAGKARQGITEETCCNTVPVVLVHHITAGAQVVVDEHRQAAASSIDIQPPVGFRVFYRFQFIGKITVFQIVAAIPPEGKTHTLQQLRQFGKQLGRFVFRLSINIKPSNKGDSGNFSDGLIHQHRECPPDLVCVLFQDRGQLFTVKDQTYLMILCFLCPHLHILSPNFNLSSSQLEPLTGLAAYPDIPMLKHRFWGLLLEVHQREQAGAKPLWTEDQFMLFAIEAQLEGSITQGRLECIPAFFNQFFAALVCFVRIYDLTQFCLNLRKGCPCFLRPFTEVLFKAGQGQTTAAIVYVLLSIFVSGAGFQGLFKVTQGGAFLIQTVIGQSDSIIPAVIFGKILLMGSQKFQRLFKRLPFSYMCNGNICLGQFAVQFRGALLGRNRFQGVDYLLRFILFKPLLALFQ